MNLNSILIGSEDPQRLTAYYTRLFGEPGWSGGDFVGWQLGTGYVTVGPHDRVQGLNPQPGRLIWNLETPDVQGAFERLKAAGATVVQEPYQPEEDPAGWIATFADPDDNDFQLVSLFRGSGLMDGCQTRSVSCSRRWPRPITGSSGSAMGPMPAGLVVCDLAGQLV